MPLIEVHEGDVFELEGVDALVVPANKQLTLGWGTHVAEAVARRAGPAVEREARAAHPRGIALGDAILTGPGDLTGFRHLIHAAVLDKYDFNPLFLLRLRERTSPATLTAATRNALSLAAGAGLRSLAFTPMGAGIGGMDDAKCARLMLAEVRTADLDRIVFACKKPKTAAAFRSAAEDGA